MITRENLNLQYITDDKGEKKAVILLIDEFQELIEDLQDLSALAQRHDEEPIPHDAVLKSISENDISD